MSEKSIINYLIKAFDFAKDEFTKKELTNGICHLVRVHLASEDLEDFMAARAYFSEFFDAVNFGLEKVYRYEMGVIIKEVNPRDLSVYERKSYYWFPLDKQHVSDRIKVCVKAIELLNEKLKHLL